ncbi:hypothetical protein KIP88_03005 [Bradyrhizobium sp. SRL28]|uniref:hypothetical protein n=1 Tax=Bradyrhizobium sp. SRL28 TaxID=2836178 RepID=UPI001BDE332C|nr:hypothetical protein [Bradyrhizobium sp. SRL28]MBT1509461.1 hypothetical protein [Bradyrhizobium sp. SRL28]
MHTKDMLADELMKIGLMDMSLQARGGYYHDFLSPLDLPEVALVTALGAAATARPDKAMEIRALCNRVINGDFDASAEESDEWAKSQEGQDTFRQLIRDRDKP